jgi:hypothetical protein
MNDDNGFENAQGRRHEGAHQGGNQGEARRYARKTYGHLAVIWHNARAEPVTREQAATRVGLGKEAVRTILLAMLAGGHLQAIPRKYTCHPQRYLATESQPPAPPERKPAKAEREQALHVEQLEATRKQFEFYPSWLIRIPRSVTAPVNQVDLFCTRRGPRLKGVAAKRQGDLAFPPSTRRHLIKC